MEPSNGHASDRHAQVVVTPWEGNEPPSEEAIRAAFAAEGLRPYRWSNAPGDVYAAHRHGYDKVLYVVSGSITFGLGSAADRDNGGEGSEGGDGGESVELVELNAGDRLDLPAGVTHDATVGPHGVVCLEAHRG